MNPHTAPTPSHSALSGPPVEGVTGLPDLAGQHRALTDRGLDLPPLPKDLVGDLLVIHPRLVPAAELAALLRLEDRPGFVVEDLTDLGEFGSAPGATVPDSDLYAVHDPDRGDRFADRSPDEVDPELRASGRELMTLSEGICWALQQPSVIERNHCFMTTGSRKPGRRAGTLDSRVPALWISNGTGRDGKERRGAPKVGWCWAGNRHTWLGIASVAGRSAPTLAT